MLDTKDVVRATTRKVIRGRGTTVDAAPSGEDTARAGFFRQNRRMCIWFVLTAFVVLFWNLGGYRTLSYHEGRVAVPAREMLQSGDWVVPRFGQMPRLVKPPLSYWTVATCAQLFGGLDEWVVRFPQAIAALLLAVLMGVWAGRWYGSAVGWGAAFIQLTTGWVLIFGRKADVDMTVWLGIATALFLIVEEPSGASRRARFFRWLGVYVLLSVSWMAKFHYGPTMVIAPVVIFFLVQKEPRRLLRFFHPLGLVLLAAAISVWPWLVVQNLQGAGHIWYEETVGRAVGDLGRDPFWYYVPVVLYYTLPWMPFALLTVGRSWREAWREGNPRERFLWIWFLVHLAIVTLQPNKHAHYICSALPVVSLWSARGLAQSAAKLTSGEWRLSRRVVIACTLLVPLGLGTAWYVALRKWPYLETELMCLASVYAVGLLAFLWLLNFRRYTAATTTIATAFLAGFVILQGWVLPGRDYRLHAANFAAEVREIAGEETVCVYQTREDPMVYYLGSPAHRIYQLATLEEVMREHRRVLVLSYSTAEAELRAAGEFRILRRIPADLDPPKSKSPPLFLAELRERSSASRVK